MIAFRHNDSRFPFLWEDSTQPPARWHRDGDGPVQYVSDTPSGAWAEFLRHEEIIEEIDLEGVRRAIWAIKVDDTNFASPDLPEQDLLGGSDTYSVCQDEAVRLRTAGAEALRVRSAALLRGAARGWRVDHGLQRGTDADGEVFVLFGPRPHAIGWQVVDGGCPPSGMLALVRPLRAP
ncbi:hypothetical protein CVV68_04670 [Arthrobacter livingstonensis]|uniref:RES domain-containing protein n=1 Tax=Arthrobacter livingstonensis TaxID=670078 RepID=A0A2V5LGJ8_9MICC|nr:hypothetical protein CVV68_04670 [Arthrobacter livingstonensis]